MADYTDPLETTFELQRASLEGGQTLIEETLDLPNRLGEATVDSLESQESVQRSVAEFQQETVHGVLDALEGNIPGEDAPTEDLREVVDEQYDAFFENHEELFDGLEDALEEGLDAYDDLSSESVDALDDLVDTLVEVQEQVEDQSVEATEQVEEQVQAVQDDLDEGADDVQAQIEEVSEQAADAVEA